MDILSFILFAERNRGESFSEGFRTRGYTGRDDVLLGLLIVTALVAGMWAISRLVSLRRRRRTYNSPWRLFWALCKAHHLNWSDSWLLRRVAREQGLRDPGRLFLEAQYWEEENLGPASASEYPRLKTLRTQILGETTRNQAADAISRPGGSVIPSALPLFPSLPSPTLDIPPWTAETE